MKRLGLILIIVIANISNAYSQTSDASKIAKTAFQQGDYAEAVNWYKSAVNLTDNPTEKAALNKSLSLAQSCAADLRQADRLFSQGNYASAKNVYQKLSNVNPSDSYARQRIALCGQRLREIANKQKRDEAYKTALQKGDAESIRAFLKSYPNDRARNLLTFILSDRKRIADSLMKVAWARRQDAKAVEKPIKEFEALFVRNNVAAGDAFFAAGNRDAAKQYYARAAAYGDAESLYKQALCYDDISAPQPRMLLAIAAAGDCSAAREELKKPIHRNLKYSEAVAKRLYDNLQTYRTNAKSALYVYENLDNYSIDRQEVEDRIANSEDVIFQLCGMVGGDHLLYQFGRVLEKLKKEPYLFMFMSATNGNIAAIKWLADNSQEAEFLRCYKISQKQDMDYKAYIKYLKGKTMTSGDWLQMYRSKQDMSLDKNEELLSLVKSDCFTNKELKKLVAEREYWDADIVKELLAFNYTIKPSRVAPLRKILSKAKTRPGLYDKQSVPVYRLAEIGCYDNLHEYKQQIKKETSWMSSATTSAGKNYSAATATVPATNKSDVYDSSSYSGKSAETAATAPKFWVGQELADGYVFYVDATGRHGKIVSKTPCNITPDKVATFRCGSGWRFVSSGELYKIYDAQLFPVGSYFAQDGPNITNYKAVVFNKKNCYSVNVNWRYTYKLLLVKNF